MPIYMDRHNMQGASARAVADAHQKDLKLQDQYGVKFLTYWFDENRGSAFCLVDAPAKEFVSRLHAEAHGSIPNKILEVDPETVKSFLGSIEDRHSGPQSGAGRSDSAFRVIMFTDMKDSTAVTSRLGDTAALEYFRSKQITAFSSLLLRFRNVQTVTTILPS